MHAYGKRAILRNKIASANKRSKGRKVQGAKRGKIEEAAIWAQPIQASRAGRPRCGDLAQSLAFCLTVLARKGKLGPCKEMHFWGSSYAGRHHLLR